MPDTTRSQSPGKVRLLDQTLLPGKITYVDTVNVDELWHAIKTLKVRGAPAIGITAAMAIAVAAQESSAHDTRGIMADIDSAAKYLSTSRPTAVNLFWAIERMLNAARQTCLSNTEDIRVRMVVEALAIRDEDDAMCHAIGEHGASLLEDGYTVLTHCNAGGLATSGYGTALAPIYTAAQQGKRISVYADETRPLLQGSRLTAWELVQAGINVTVICDNTAAHVMKHRKINAVLVGADRIAANGDTANKIGTYGLALLAKAHNVPFYVLAPTSTIDLEIADGNTIPIEERGREEVVNAFGTLTAPENAAVYSPAFDVTPASLITAIVCEEGIARKDFQTTLRKYVIASHQ
ncbi:MAG: S-methyl-5-thioribose-1-phosphate isomerase, partial [Lentisphaerae bacterium]|nr:S-methyl-5-thioribose-1-phosphate isomerase [Lentisphaerota bacterium]